MRLWIGTWKHEWPKTWKDYDFLVLEGKEVKEASTLWAGDNQWEWEKGVPTNMDGALVVWSEVSQ